MFKELPQLDYETLERGNIRNQKKKIKHDNKIFFVKFTHQKSPGFLQPPPPAFPLYFCLYLPPLSEEKCCTFLFPGR